MLKVFRLHTCFRSAQVFEFRGVGPYRAVACSDETRFTICVLLPVDGG